MGARLRPPVLQDRAAPGRMVFLDRGPAKLLVARSERSGAVVRVGFTSGRPKSDRVMLRTSCSMVKTTWPPSRSTMSLKRYCH